MSGKKYIEVFIPDVKVLEQKHQGYLDKFDAGQDFKNFNDLIKMFAVSKKYQNVFYSYDGEEKPVSAWILQSIIDKCNTMIHQVAGFKAIFLHSVPTAEQFYRKNQFKNIEANMLPLHCIDNDLTPMYLPLKPIHMNYEK